MTSEQKRTVWQQHIDNWLESQLSQKDFCQKHNLILATFGYWRTKLKQKPKTTKKFIPVNTAKQTGTVKIFLPSGIHLEVPAYALADILPLVSQTVQEPA